MCALGDIFQDKLDKLLCDIKGVKTYIDDILVLIKQSFSKHIYQIRVTFTRLRTAGLKVNAPKCSFGLKYVPYLGYVITRDGIKPDPKKLQRIMDLVRPITTTESRGLSGMFHYYRHIWSWRSHILASLTEVSAGTKGRKVIWNYALK